MADKSQRSDVTLDTIVSLCKRRGIIFPGSDIYGGLQGTFDYGPVGAELKRNVKNAWWRSMVQERFDIEGIDTCLLLHPSVWKASGHVENFTDPLCDSLGPSRKRYRADHIEDSECARFTVTDVTDEAAPKAVDVEIWAPAKKKAKEFFTQWYEKALGLEGKRVKIEEVEGSRQTGRFSPDDGGRLTEARMFNLMLSTTVGPVEESSAKVYLRPETAQGIFINYENARAAARRRLPFGIAQQGKSFRNEITPRNFIFRTREFEQMEMEFFCKPAQFCKPVERTDMEWFEYWRNERLDWYVRHGIKRENLKFYDHPAEKLSHYSRGTTDIEYLYPIGWQELEGVAHRGDFDLTQHMQHSGKDLRYFDNDVNAHYVPNVIEPAAGVDRATLAFLCDAYKEEVVARKGEADDEGGGKENKRVVLALHKDLAPVKAAVLPLLANRDELVAMGRKLALDLKKHMNAVYDDTAGIGKLYRRQDEVGTPWCITVDVDSLTDGAVTIRDRDTMQQQRVAADKVVGMLKAQLEA